MRKLTAVILALVLMFSLSATVLAEEVKSEGKTGVLITASIEPTYTVTIPESIKVTFNKEATTFGNVALTAAQLEPNHSVKVVLNASGALKHNVDKKKTIAYTITDDKGKAFNEISFTAPGKVPLTINITREAWNKANAGTYADTVTFTVSYGKS